MAATSRSRGPPLANSTCTVSPTSRERSVASSSNRAILPGPRSSSDPSSRSTSTTRAAGTGSTAETCAASPSNRNWSKRTPVTAGRSSSVAIDAATVGLNPVKVGLDTTKSARTDPSTDAAKESLIDVPATNTVVTRARPIMRAEAARAVRWGVRTALARARRPEMDSAAKGRPRTEDTGTASSGLSEAVPTNTSTAPTARVPKTGTAPSNTNRASTTATIPTPRSTPPVTHRRRPPDSSTAGPSRRAATGGTEAARRAGNQADSSVTGIPTTSAAITVRAVSCSVSSGRVNPPAASSACSATAISSPNPIPTTDATAPMSPASSTTEPTIWRRLAPTARNRASSRVRWPRRMANVLLMKNAETRSATPAKPSSTFWNTDRNPSTLWAPSAFTSSMVTASTPSGRTRCTRSVRSSPDTPSAATTSIPSYWPGAPNASWADARSKPVRRAPRRLLVSPKVNTPTISTSREPPSSRTVVRSPTRKP